MKDVELKVIVELLRNSRRSDRELARAVRVSQPTITRTRQRLENQGIIREYTIIPDYSQLGFTLMSMTFTKMEGQLSEEVLGDYAKRARDRMSKNPSALVLGCTGMGCNADYVTVAFHRDYSEYCEFMRDIRRFPNVSIDETQSFVIDVADKNQFQPLSLRYLTEYLAKAEKSKHIERKRATPKLLVAGAREHRPEIEE